MRIWNYSFRVSGNGINCPHIFRPSFVCDNTQTDETKVPSTVMCLSIGTPINNKIFICPKWNINYFWCPKIKNLYSLVIMFFNIVTPKIINFPFGTNGKLMVSYLLPQSLSTLGYFRVLVNALCCVKVRIFIAK